MSSPHDHPLDTPAQDLLDMAPHAEALARSVGEAPLPYVVGIYGAWGEGKTTFARLLKHYLTQLPGWTDARFVAFSAWPYVTADSIWRALLEKVAEEIYCVDEATAAAGRGEESFRPRLRRMLLAPVFRRDDSPAKDNVEKLQRFVGRLGGASVLANRSRRDSETTQQLSMLAGLAIDIASTVAAPMGVLRRLFGLSPDGGARNNGLDAVVASVEEMRDGIRDLFNDAGSVKTIVLLDDLDRCMPEVALDVLETIKIFFSESTAAKGRCLFLIAADERVLDQGLRSRLGNGGEVPAALEARAYLEKVVQFGVRMSEVRKPDSHRLVATAFPEWCGVADLLMAGAGVNPRRLKQQCHLLSYGYSNLENGAADEIQS